MSIEIKKRRILKVNRLGKCDVCKSTQAIYTCPRCETVTCSLACVKTHKSQLDCDGVRVRTKYVAADKMDGNTLLSDYRLMEDVSRCLEYAEELREDMEAAQATVPERTSGPRTEDNPEEEEEESESVESSPKKGDPDLDLDPQSEEPKAKKSKSSRRAQRRLNKIASIKQAQVVGGNKSVAKTTLLIAKANRIKDRVLKKQRATNKAGVSMSSSEVTKAPVPVVDKSANKPSPESIQVPPPQNIQVPPSQRIQVPQPQKIPVSVSDKKKIQKRKKTAISKPKPFSASSSRIIAKPEPTKLQDCDLHQNQSSNQDSDDIVTKRKLTMLHLLKTMKRGGKGKEMALETLKKASLRRNIALKVLPHKFQRHYENTSYFFQRDDCIFWYIKISFLNANVFTLSLNQCAETKTLGSVIKECLKRSRAHSRKNKVKDPLEVYRKVGMSKMKVLMVADKVNKCHKRFYELDMGMTLVDNFFGKCVVEYPQFCVVLQDCYVAPIVKEDIVYNFFDDEDFEEQFAESDDDFKVTKAQKRKHEARNSDSLNDEDRDRESGELTDSSEDDSDEELFKESEFRSIYVDLLKTIN